MSAEPPRLAGERAARALRHELGLGFAPVDIWDVLRRRGVCVALHDFGADGGDGLYLWQGGEKGGIPLVVINSAKRASRQRFTAAHELGHHELHRFAGADVVIADEETGGSDGDEQEVAANTFAAYLLAPSEDLREWFRDLGSQQVTPSKVVGLMRRYGLSYQAVAYRLCNSGLIRQRKLEELLTTGEGQIDRLAKQQGFSESMIFPAPSVVPDQLRQGAILLYQRFVITEARLAEILELSIEQALEAVRDSGMERPSEPPVDEQAVKELLG